MTPNYDPAVAFLDPGAVARLLRPARSCHGGPRGAWAPVARATRTTGRRSSSRAPAPRRRLGYNPANLRNDGPPRGARRTGRRRHDRSPLPRRGRHAGGRDDRPRRRADAEAILLDPTAERDDTAGALIGLGEVRPAARANADRHSPTASSSAASRRPVYDDTFARRRYVIHDLEQLWAETAELRVPWLHARRPTPRTMSRSSSGAGGPRSVPRPHQPRRQPQNAASRWRARRSARRLEGAACGTWASMPAPPVQFRLGHWSVLRTTFGRPWRTRTADPRRPRPGRGRGRCALRTRDGGWVCAATVILRIHRLPASPSTPTNPAPAHAAWSCLEVFRQPPNERGVPAAVVVVRRAGRRDARTMGGGECAAPPVPGAHRDGGRASMTTVTRCSCDVEVTADDDGAFRRRTSCTCGRPPDWPFPDVAVEVLGEALLRLTGAPIGSAPSRGPIHPVLPDHVAMVGVLRPRRFRRQAVDRCVYAWSSTPRCRLGPRGWRDNRATMERLLREGRRRYLPRRRSARRMGQRRPPRRPGLRPRATEDATTITVSCFNIAAPFRGHGLQARSSTGDRERGSEAATRSEAYRTRPAGGDVEVPSGSRSLSSRPGFVVVKDLGPRRSSASRLTATAIRIAGVEASCGEGAVAAVPTPRRRSSRSRACHAPSRLGQERQPRHPRLHLRVEVGVGTHRSAPNPRRSRADEQRTDLHDVERAPQEHLVGRGRSDGQLHGLGK